MTKRDESLGPRAASPRPMSNDDVGDVFAEVAELIDIQNGSRFRAIAFRRSARLISRLREPVGEQLAFGRLQQTPGIGKGTVERVKAILRHGTFDELERLRAQVPTGLRQLLALKGIGPKTAKALWQQLGISTVVELERALLTGQIDVISGIGGRTKERIVDAIRYSREDTGRILITEALALGARIVASLSSLPEVIRIEQCGSARRRKALVGDLDILVGADDKRVISSYFCSMPGVVDVLLRGDGRCSVRLDQAVQVDLRVVSPETFGAGMHYFTGSQLHNIRVRTKANAKGWAINEHGIFVRAFEKPARGTGKPSRGASDQRIAWGRNEHEIFSSVGLQYISPELRENDGEIEAAAKGALPNLVDDAKLNGELHVRFSPAVSQTLATLVARGRRWAVVVRPARATKDFVDDVKRLAREHGLALACGVEVAIAPDGSVPPRRKNLPWVVAQIPEDEVVPGVDVTERLLCAIESDRIDVLARPSGRVLLSHDGHHLDWEKILRALARRGVVLEVRGHPLALDPAARVIRRAHELGVLLSLSGAPTLPDDVTHIDCALWEARRGWTTARHVLECGTLDDALARRLPSARKKRMPSAVSSTTVVASDTSLDAALSLAMASHTLSSSLRKRAERFVAGDLDPALEDSLARLFVDDPPLSSAFRLTSFSISPDGDDDADDADEVARHANARGEDKVSAPPKAVSTAPRVSVLRDFVDDDSNEGAAAIAPDVVVDNDNASDNDDSSDSDSRRVLTPMGEKECTVALTSILDDGKAASPLFEAHLHAYLRGDGDAVQTKALEESLRARDENPLKLAFSIVAARDR